MTADFKKLLSITISEFEEQSRLLHDGGSDFLNPLSDLSKVITQLDSILQDSVQKQAFENLLDFSNSDINELYHQLLEDSGLPAYLALDNWHYSDALLLLSNINPEGALISEECYRPQGTISDQKFIQHAIFFGEGIRTYDIPSEQEIIEKKAKNLDLIEAERSRFNSIGKSADLDEYLVGLDKLTSEETNLSTHFEKLEALYRDAWKIRRGYSAKLTLLYRLWLSGDHEEKNPPEYYVNWAVDKRVNIPWLTWAQNNGYFSGIGTRLESADSLEPKQDFIETGELGTAFYPASTSALSDIFTLHQDKSKNLAEWRKLANDASRNGLAKARVTQGRGKAESKFDLWLVGEWLVEQKGIPWGTVSRKLVANLKPGYEHLKDQILS